MSVDLHTPRTDTAPGRVRLAQQYGFIPMNLDGWFYESIAEAANRASEVHARESSAAQSRKGATA